MKLTTKLGAKLVSALVVLLIASWSVSAQETTTANGNEKRVSLNEAAVAHDDDGAPALQGTLRTTALNGSPDSPVTNVRLIVKNTSGIPYAFVSGVVTFYDAAGIRVAKGSSRPMRWRLTNRSRLTVRGFVFVAKRARGESSRRTCCLARQPRRHRRCVSRSGLPKRPESNP